MSLEITVDIRKELGPVRDQGTPPDLFGIRRIGCASTCAQAPRNCLCVEWLYYHAVRLSGGGPDDGATADNTRKALREIGQPEEVDWPYSPVSAGPGRLGNRHSLLQRC